MASQIGLPWATFAWTLALSVSYLLIMLTAPLIGAHADARAAKKRWLLATTVGCVLGTAGLMFAGPGALALAVAFLIFSNFCFGSGENLIAAFLHELADEAALGKVSGYGWSLGYLGGLLTERSVLHCNVVHGLLHLLYFIAMSAAPRCSAGHWACTSPA